MIARDVLKVNKNQNRDDNLKMRNSTALVNVDSSPAVTEIGSQITYMTRSKRGKTSSQTPPISTTSCETELKRKTTLRPRRDNHSGEGSRSELSEKQFNNGSQETVDQCIPSLTAKKLSRHPATIVSDAHSVPNVDVENPAVTKGRSSKREQNLKKNSHVCVICHKEFSCRSKLQQHATRHDPKKPYGCEICGKFFDDARFVKTHRTLHEKKSHKECDICGKVFNERIFFDIHRLTHFEQKPFRCDICEDIFKDRTSFMRHRNNHKARVRKVAERFLTMKEVLKQKLEDSK